MYTVYIYIYKQWTCFEMIMAVAELRSPAFSPKNEWGATLSACFRTECTKWRNEVPQKCDTNHMTWCGPSSAKMFEAFVAWKPRIYHLLPLNSRNWLVWIEIVHDRNDSVGWWGLKLTWFSAWKTSFKLCGTEWLWLAQGSMVPNISVWKITIFHGKTHHERPFSTAM